MKKSVRDQTKQPRALTIAGSDSGGGAGIQADLKTFAALGVHGMSAITALTAQNTRQVTSIFPVPPDFVLAQIDAVYSDIGVEAVKTGMLYGAEIIHSVAQYLRKHKPQNLVVDPVMVSKSGFALLQRNAVQALKHDLFPLADIITPNAEEAGILSGSGKIRSVKQASSVAEKLTSLGPQVVVVKGGHLDQGRESVDVVYSRKSGEFSYLRSSRIKTKDTHGTGCVFASAIAAELAKGRRIEQALDTAKIFVTDAIKYSLRVGRGSGPVNPTGLLVDHAQRYAVLSNLSEAVKILEENGSSISKLIPELRTNIGMALEGAKRYEDIAAVPGRITSLPGGRVRAVAPPEFGASRHIANSILAALQFNPDSRAAMNIRYEEKLVGLCKKIGLVVSSYDRSKEPADVKKKEGSSTFWGATTAIADSRVFPDAIYHRGDFGKEPMIVLLGRDAVSVALKAVKLGAIS